MTKRSKAQRQQALAQVSTEAQTPAEELVLATGELPDGEPIPAEAPQPKTVVRTGYKRSYQDAAKARGERDKASRRANGDWLQKELQAETIGEKGAFLWDRFVAILRANGIGPETTDRWSQTSKGWEGRWRMSGGLVLRGVVGKSGLLRLPEGNTVSVTELAEQGDENAQAFLAKWAN